MKVDLPFDVVELVSCPMMSMPSARLLRETVFREDAWLPEDIDRLRVLFQADEGLDGIAGALGRTTSSIQTKIGELGLRRNSSRPWSELEDAELGRRYGVDATSTIAVDFGRSPAAIYARAGLLGLTEGNPPPYSEWEIAQIRAGYHGGIPVAQLGVLIARPVTGIASIASKLGIRHANCPPDWSETEQQRALEMAEEGRRYRQIVNDMVGEGFPKREHGAIGQVLRRLGYKRGWGRPWIGEEDDLIRLAYARGDSLTPLQGRLGRSRTSISYRAGELDLHGTHARPNGWRTDPPWSDDDIAILRRDYGRVPTPELARRLNRKKGGVFNKAFSLGLKHGYGRPFGDEEETGIRLAHAHGVSLSDLSAALARDPAVVSKHAIRMGIPFSKRAQPAPRGRRALRPKLTLASILLLGAEAANTAPPQSAEEPGSAADLPIAGSHQHLLAGPGLASMPTAILAAMLRAGLLEPIGASTVAVLLGPSKPN